MKSKSGVMLHAIISMDDAELGNFQRQLAAVKDVIKLQGNNVLIHSCYAQQRTNKLLLVESYKNEAAFLLHLELIKNIQIEYPVKMTYHNLILVGSCSDSTVQLLNLVLEENRLIHFNRELSV